MGTPASELTGMMSLAVLLPALVSDGLETVAVFVWLPAAVLAGTE